MTPYIQKNKEYKDNKLLLGSDWSQKTGEQHFKSTE